MTEAQRVRAEVRYSNAQQDERRAREAHDQAGVDRAKAEQVAAMDELYKLREDVRTGAHEGRVVLVCPNPNANLTDANGVTFVGGRAEGVPRPLARKYCEDFDGYAIEEESA
ncbi:MAG: hypothetical protein M3R38_05355 [Actinomycetota bacterium]|nr:hypothetical protein [Actinomycetota bacterium]